MTTKIIALTRYVWTIPFKPPCFMLHLFPTFLLCILSFKAPILKIILYMQILAPAWSTTKNNGAPHRSMNPPVQTELPDSGP